MHFKLRKNAGQQSLDEWSFDPTEEVGSNDLELNAFGVDVSAVDRGGYGLGTGAPDGHSNGWALDDEVAAVPTAETPDAAATVCVFRNEPFDREAGRFPRRSSPKREDGTT